MNFEQIKQIEPALAKLERHAEHAGRHGASWTSYLLASHEALTKATGRGAAIEELQTAEAYEICRAALFAAWSRGSKESAGSDVQTTMFDCSSIYQ
ncbi:MAG: hypothetical protein JXM70_07965 [Pirellulales bacterium]|nr:hypothetical protein [Pirellulales bacterium]